MPYSDFMFDLWSTVETFMLIASAVMVVGAIQMSFKAPIPQ
ncbi:hypothetical protein [Vibrio taketomensis]|nr:hypothetical protein [Vibrio taketomensis]